MCFCHALLQGALFCDEVCYQPFLQAASLWFTS